MKLIVLSLLPLLLEAGIASSQPTLELSGGLNVANFSDPGDLIAGATWSSRLGFTGGASVNLPLTDHLMLSPGLRITQKGTKSAFTTSTSGNINATLTNTYLEIPVYAQWKVADFGTTIHLVGGPAVGFLMGSRTDATSDLSGSAARDSEPDYKSYDASVDFGLSLRHPLGDNISLVGTAYYSYGFVPISALGSTEQTRDFRFLLGISFPFDRK
jgi:hypothetical protein